MPSESEVIISFIFKRSGKTKLSFSEFYLTLSMDLKWFTPEDAKSFVNMSIKNKLLRKTGDIIQPDFNLDNITIPVGFVPLKKVFFDKETIKQEKQEQNILDKILNRIVEKTSLEKKQINQQITNIVKEKNITEEVAALLICKEHSLLIDDFINEVEKSIFTKNKE